MYNAYKLHKKYISFRFVCFQLGIVEICRSDSKNEETKPKYVYKNLVVRHSTNEVYKMWT